MKRINLFLIFSLITSFSKASTDSCLLSSLAFMNGNSSDTSPQDCLSLISSESAKREFVSHSNTRVVAFKEMAYIVSDNSNTLLAGNQTKLINPVFLNLNEETNSLIIGQAEEGGFSYSFFLLNLIGNVTPRFYYFAPSEHEISQISFLSERNELALISKANKSIEFINADADSRYENENKKHKLKLKRSLAGAQTQLTAPQLVIESNLKKEIYVLDSNRILVYSELPQGDETPLRVIESSQLEKVTSIKLNQFENEILCYEGANLLKSVYIDE